MTANDAFRPPQTSTSEEASIRPASGTSYATIAILILAGEAAFLLPFVLPRIFRPTVLDAFQMDNLALGKCFSVYGIVAMVSYFFGGPIADRFPPRKLMAIALWTTALGGVIISTYPSHSWMQLVYGYWGFTTIFLFWAAMLKATRQWGGSHQQGKAFGFLDGGRGLVSAGIGSVGVALFALAMGSAAGNATLEQQQAAFRNVIYFTSGLVAVIGGLVWWFLDLPNASADEITTVRKKLSSDNVRMALRLRSVWLLMLIVLCGYVGYKATDDLSLYAKEVMLLNEVNAAKIGTMLLYVRPVVGVAVGFLADWSRSATWMIVGFILMLLGSVLIGLGLNEPEGYVLFYASLLATCVGVYSIRSLYFAAMQEGKIPLHITGTAVGLISVVGYTPDIFMGPAMGYLLDRSPGEPGHQHLFWLLAGFAAVGLLATVAFRVSCTESRSGRADPNTESA